MILKPAKHKMQRKLVNVEYIPAVIGCDCCKKAFGKDDSELQITVFNKEKNKSTDTIHMVFCSWVCLWKMLPAIKCDNFISMPFLSFDTTTAGTKPKDLFNLIDKSKLK